MTTLYDLLGALPNDDAEGLRTAFRRAVKGAHPDIRPGDPDAPQRFREIVRAHELLGDNEQRAVYDDLLEHARLEQESAFRHSAAARMNKLVSGVIALSGASVATLGGYLLFMQMSAASVASIDNGRGGGPASHQIAAVRPADASAANYASQGNVSTGSAALPAMPETAVATIAIPNNRPESAGDANPGTTAASYPAISPDPPLLPPAYLDRGIIFYPIKKTARVFPDLARAKRSEKSRPPAPAMTGRPPFNQGVILPMPRPLYLRRTAPQDPSRDAGFASAMLR
jgi:curved DNA-binding protein CbpA